MNEDRSAIQSKELLRTICLHTPSEPGRRDDRTNFHQDNSTLTRLSRRLSGWGGERNPTGGQEGSPLVSPFQNYSLRPIRATAASVKLPRALGARETALAGIPDRYAPGPHADDASFQRVFLHTCR